LSILKTASAQLRDSFRFLVTYGAGIGALVGPVTQYLQQEYPTLNREQIAALFIMAISIVYFENQNLKKSKEWITIRNLDDELESAVEYIQKLKNKVKNILNVSGASIYRSMDILSYTFLLPIFSTLLNLMTNQEVSNDLMTDLFEPLVSSGLITLSGAAIKEFIDRLVNRL
jgi:predicted PurR-regulated permease PerM